MQHPMVAYFSASGTTARVAKDLAQAAGASLYEIRPAVPYTAADLNWQDSHSRSSVEMADKSSRPALADGSADVAGSDVIFLGFPIWWYTAPTIVRTFLEGYDFSGKTVVLFATSGGSGLGSTAADLRSSVSPDTRLVEGKLLNGRPSEAALKAWVDALGL